MAPARFDPRPVAARLQKLCSLRPRLALVLGSSFHHVASQVRTSLDVPFTQLPGFPQTSVKGHAGHLVIGHLSHTPLIVLNGRAHLYEGHPMEAVTFPIRVLAALGIRDLLLTNAAGGINRRFRSGEFMRVTDHLNFMGRNPLVGPALPGLPRFVDLTRTYDRRLNSLLESAAKKAKTPLRSGVYLAVSGPSYETAAEVRAFGLLGADAVGMSTVPEAIVARQCGLAVAALSCITNLAAGKGKEPLSHAEVLAAGERVQHTAATLVKAFVELYAHSE
jgi:purine-nucleoside phosphorylase